MPRRQLVVLLVALSALAPVPGGATEFRAGEVRVTVDAAEVSVTNGIISRTWDADAVRTTSLRDHRTGLALTTPHADFSLTLDGARVPSDLMTVATVEPGPGPMGAGRLTWRLLVPGVASITRTVDIWPGIAGLRSQTTIESAAPVALSGYSMDEVAAGATATPTLHAFRAGSDWRFDAGWNPMSIGDARKGGWRVTTAGAPGAPIAGSGEWLSLAMPGGPSIGLVSERRDYASSALSYDGTAGRAEVDLSRDVVYFGPIEEQVHTENPTPAPARHRVVTPLEPMLLEPGFTILGEDADDEPWQFTKYLRTLRPGTTDKRIIFNTDKVDGQNPSRSTGAKDDVDFTRFLTLADAAREMGVDTFVFDDGWQAISGDWCPDSPRCPEPRNQPGVYSRSLDPTVRKYPDRFPDDTFAAVRQVLAGDPDTTEDDMKLGLWFTPMEFHPASKAYTTNPQWACAPVGDGTAGLSVADPNSSSNEAGLGVWNPLAWGVDPDDGVTPMRLIDYIEGRIRRAIDVYGASYFKFDFLVWLDCGGAYPVDMYGYRDAFVAMLDRLAADHPDVTFTIDETNDYRMFPFESLTRGATWFQNGTPAQHQLLHNLWSLAPHVDGSTLGQAALGNGGDRATVGVDTLMAAALGSHITFWTQIDTALSGAQRAAVRRWTDFYHDNVALLTGVTYPLLSDPIGKGWTGLQLWNRDLQRGFLLVFRQSAGDAGTPATTNVMLRGQTEDSYTLTRIDVAAGTTAPAGTHARGVSIPVTVADRNGHALFLVEPA